MANDATSKETVTAIHNVMEQVCDIVATFDDRLTYEAKTDDETTLHFTAVHFHAQLHVACECNADEIITIHLKSSDSLGISVESTIYHGAADVQIIRKSLETAMATWYGNAVRSMHMSM